VNVFFEDDPRVITHVNASTVCMMPIDKELHDLTSIVEPLLG